MEYLCRPAQWGSEWCTSAVAAMGPVWVLTSTACLFIFISGKMNSWWWRLCCIKKKKLVVKKLLYQTVIVLTVSVIVSKEKIGLVSEQPLYMQPKANYLHSVWLRQIKMFVTHAKRKEIVEDSTRTLTMVTSFSSVVHEQLQYISPLILGHKKLSEVICLVRQYVI